MLHGYIKKWDQQKGWGFIEATDGNDYFINISNVRRGVRLREGIKVKFDPSCGQRGDEAENVSLV